MQIHFEPILLPKDQNDLIAFLSSQDWPFHINKRLSVDRVNAMIEEGVFDGSNHQSFWIRNENSIRIGFIRIFDLDDVEDGYPLFDLRIAAKFRGLGVGKTAVQWLTRYLFDKYPGLERIAASTRADNFAMRKTLRSCLYVKEAHYRKDWSSQEGALLDTVKYGILREDWLSEKITPVNWNDEI